MTSAIIDAEPEPIQVDFSRAALVIIDMQRDFLEPWPRRSHRARRCSRRRARPA
jgi:isochorismate hydrolase